MINFEDLKLEIQDEFISSNISEILYRQREKDGLSQERFLAEYFEYNIYTKIAGTLSLSQLKRYEKNYREKSSTIKPQKSSEIFNIIRRFSVTNDLYQREIYNDYLKEDSFRLAERLEELGLLDCIEKATNGLAGMNEFNIKFGKTYDKSVLLDWLFTNANKALNGEDIPQFIYSQTKTRHDIKGGTKN